MKYISNKLQGGLLVSCQPVPKGPLDTPDIVAGFALAVLEGGACGLRIEGIDNLRAVRRLTSVPIIGLVKSIRMDTEIRITSTTEEVDALAAEGADIIAFDATDRPRPESRKVIIEKIQGHGITAMADCSNFADGQYAVELGCEILGTTLSGYVGSVVPREPDLHLVEELSELDGFVIAEGRYHQPALAAQAITAGADAVVVGSAITRPEHIASWFAAEVRRAKENIEAN